MRRWFYRLCVCSAFACTGAAFSGEASVGQTEPPVFQPADVFELEWASDPRVSPDGRRIVYVRNGMDVMKDRRRSSLWIVGTDGNGHRPLTDGTSRAGAPRWSPDGSRVLYVSDASGASQLWVVWVDGGQRSRLTQLVEEPADPVWSPDGTRIAFSMFVPAAEREGVAMPDKPEGAEWAAPPKVIDTLIYRRDGRGFVDEGHQHLFVLPAEGGSARRVTRGDFDHRGPVSWMPDGRRLVFSANRRDDWQYEPNDSEIYTLDLADGTLTALTARKGPDANPAVSPDGRWIAFTGYDDRYQGYQVTELYRMRADGSDVRRMTPGLDRSVRTPSWDARSEHVYFAYTDQGDAKVARVGSRGAIEAVTGGVGGTSLGRPYPGGSFTVAGDGVVAFTRVAAARPADVALASADGDLRPLTRLNQDLLAHRRLGSVEELWWESSHDGRRIQGWICKPPGFDPTRRYPLILEIHGGPFADYGARFAAEIQLYAAEGYVVLYANPRGSTSYGEEFGNLIHHAYPGNDYDDLMSGVDAVIERGFVDPERLYVTGGSGGGVLTAWIVGRTDRFRAAAVAKPVINWYSFALTADVYNFFYRYWFPGFPWDHVEHYMARSPISLVGRVSTPTMLLTGEQDYRTPMSESEQYYQALKLRRVETALVRFPGASHGIANRPSQLVAKVAHVLDWFERHP